MGSTYEVSVKTKICKNFAWVLRELENMGAWCVTKIYAKEELSEFVFTITVDGDNSIHQQTEIANRKISRLVSYLESKYRIDILSTTKVLI